MAIIKAHISRFFFVFLSLLILLGTGGVRRDPLTDAEIDQLRETAQEPTKRLKLYIKFARARLVAIDQLRADPKFAPDRGQRIHDLLEDFGNIVDEIDDNIDSYSSRGEDLRKPLKDVIEADADWQIRLRTLKESATASPVAAKEARDYSLTLDMAIDSVNSSADEARKTLDEQVAAKASKKKKD